MSSRWQEGDQSNEDAATTFHCPGTERSPALVADHYDSASGLTLTASRADLLKTLAQSRPRSYGAGDTFLTVPYRPILARRAALAIALAIVIATLPSNSGPSPHRPQPRRCTSARRVEAEVGVGADTPWPSRATRAVAGSPKHKAKTTKERDLMHNQHIDLSQTLADQHRTQLQEQATHQRVLPTDDPPPRRRTSLLRRWWQLLTHRPSRAS